MDTDNSCFFCGSGCEVNNQPQLSYSKKYCCSYCGEYLLDTQDSESLSNQSDNKFKIACVLNERRLKGLGGIAFDNKTDKKNKVLGYPRISVADILDEFPQKASEFLNRTLLNLSRLISRPFAEITLKIGHGKKDNLFLFSEEQESSALIDELSSQNLLSNCQFTSEGIALRLTSRSWEIIDNLKNSAIDSKQAFVAMWFDESMDDYYEDGIKKAVEKAGYSPVKINSKDFNGKICDEIIAEIKRSKFLISDFTGQRGGVYFEAGYAMGQGKPVIFAVASSDIDKLHFDTRQYNHISYDSPEDLREKLYNRICATIV